MMTAAASVAAFGLALFAVAYAVHVYLFHRKDKPMPATNAAQTNASDIDAITAAIGGLIAAEVAPVQKQLDDAREVLKAMDEKVAGLTADQTDSDAIVATAVSGLKSAVAAATPATPPPATNDFVAPGATRFPDAQPAIDPATGLPLAA